MKRTIYLLSVAAAVIGTLSMTGCRKDPLKDMSAEESRIYITNKDQNANFANYKTVSIVDSVAVINNRDQPKKELTDYDKQLIASVKTQLQAKGYTLVDKTAKPDLAINLTRMDNSFNSVYYDPGYWSGWGGYWDPGYWGFPGYGYFFPSYYVVYRTSEKSVVIDLLDLKNQQDKKLHAVWNALLRGTGVWNLNNVDSMIKQVFDQSAYLTNKTNG